MNKNAGGDTEVWTAPAPAYTGTDTGVGRPLVRQLADQEYQGAKLVAQLAFFLLLLPGDILGNLSEENACAILPNAPLLGDCRRRHAGLGGADDDRVDRPLPPDPVGRLTIVTGAR